MARLGEKSVERFGVRGDDQHPNHSVPVLPPLSHTTLQFWILGGKAGPPMLGMLGALGGHLGASRHVAASGYVAASGCVATSRSARMKS